jgi:putative restriction endonuclease
MRMYVGITDFDWFKLLKRENCDEVNFWKPGGSINFRALNEGDLFLFKLHSPYDYIVGGGFFLKF